MSTILDKDRQERIKELHETFPLQEIANMYGVSKTRIFNIVTKNAKEKEKNRNKKYFVKLKTDEVRFGKYKEKKNELGRLSYHTKPDLRKKKIENSSKSIRENRKDPEYLKMENDNARNRYSIKTGKFIREFFEGIEDGKNL